jgi:hypothetical protein
MVNDRPAQILPLFTESIGRLFTVTEETAGAAETQPTELVPVTE